MGLIESVVFSVIVQVFVIEQDVHIFEDTQDTQSVFLYFQFSHIKSVDVQLGVMVSFSLSLLDDNELDVSFGVIIVKEEKLLETKLHIQFATVQSAIYV